MVALYVVGKVLYGIVTLCVWLMIGVFFAIGWLLVTILRGIAWVYYTVKDSRT